MERRRRRKSDMPWGVISILGLLAIVTAIVVVAAVRKHSPRQEVAEKPPATKPVAAPVQSQPVKPAEYDSPNREPKPEREEREKGWDRIKSGEQVAIVLSLLFIVASFILPPLLAGKAEPFRSALIWAGIGCGSTGLLGAMLSQLSPIFGIFLYHLAEPFSPAKLTLIPTHVFAFGLAGLFLGGAAGLIKAQSSPRRSRLED